MKYEFSVDGLNKAIAHRHATARRRRILMFVGVIALVGIVSPHTASVIAFKCI